MTYKLDYTNNRNRQTIRFRKWSHNAYATFVGIHRNISIGTLAAEIADRLMLKTNKLTKIELGGSHLSLEQKSMSEVLSNES